MLDKMPPLILGVGNLQRGDDAAGLLAARKLREMGIDAREHSGEALSLIECWSEGGRETVLIDAVATGKPAGAIMVLDATSTPVAPEAFPCSTHAFGVAEAIELGRALGRLPSRLVIYGIEAASFDAGAPVSPEVLAAVEEVAANIAGQLAHEASECTNHPS